MKTRSIVYLLLICLTIIFSCSDKQTNLNVQGVTIDLAELRKQQLSDIQYFIFFDIPDSLTSQIQGKITIGFNFVNIKNQPLILDFKNKKKAILELKLNQKRIGLQFKNQHIIIPARKLNNGRNTIEIDFTVNDGSLNRNTEYLYTLFVPDRASTAFPCFDQPSLKARFTLELRTPTSWSAVSNSSVLSVQQNKSFKLYSFNESEPISTYLFSFTAGIFKSESLTQNGKTITMYHRESDSLKVTRNLNQIFDLHFSSLQWLEQYTAINYPFQKFDFVVIPSFQYSGMEHPGAILYRDSKLFLNESAGIREQLSRANLIAHETAHIWFGDLVTMDWFSQVWLKEVFANFIADKIVNPLFPEVNHQLNFLISHYPEAYSVDRTSGANPIDQQLENQNNAGTLYGSIIYHKAPIIMYKLEKAIGDSILKSGLQEYLLKYKFANATWDNLIDILSAKTDFDLNTWSNNWVKKSNMPTIKIDKAFNAQNKLSSLIVEQSDPSESGKKWPQEIELLLLTNGRDDFYNIQIEDTFSVIPVAITENQPELILPNSNGFGYGYFELDELSKKFLLRDLSVYTNPVTRCSAYNTCWENMLNKNINQKDLLAAFLQSLKTETDEQNISLLLSYVSTIYWIFLLPQHQKEFNTEIDHIYWNKIQNSSKPTHKYLFLKSYFTICNSEVGVEKLYQIWSKNLNIKDINLSENDFTELACEIALRTPAIADSVLQIQISNILDAERKAKLIFMKPALSSDIEEINRFFESLKIEKNREKEPWVISALTYLHHPLRSEESKKYIRPSLDLLEEIQSTGDIFFPKQWLDATFSGHSSIDAVITINVFLNENPDYPINLKNKIIQSSDMLFRASQISGK
jgi:aminopeptidase N